MARDNTEGREAEPSRRGENEQEHVFSSRLIVKNVPKYVDERRLKEHFGSHGEVTDCKVMRTREGSSRCFGFVGFAQEADAVAAQKYYNKTYMDAMKIEVEFARKVGQEARKDAWSKYTEGTSRFKERHMATGANTVEIPGNTGVEKELNDGMGEKDPKLQEFLALMQPRHKKAVWANDDDVQDQEGALVKNLDRGKDIMVDAVNESDDEYEEIGPGDDDDDEGENRVQEDGEKVDEVVVNTAVSDMDYLKSRMKAEFSDDDDGGEEEEEVVEEPKESEEANSAEEEEGEKSEGPSGTPEEAQERSATMPDKEARNNDPLEIIRQTSRLFARNLPYSANEEDVQSFFENFGDLENVHIVMDKATRKSKGYALIQFSDPNDAVKAFSELDGSIFMGRLLHILPGKAAPQQVNGLAEMEDGAGTSSFKREKESKKQEEATNKVAWNSLFMRADTIADAVADMYDMSKSDLLDPSASDMAVRLALGEVKVINMTKEHLEENGVNINALEVAAQASGKSGKATGKVQRSNSTLLVKNLPYSLDEQELKGLFTTIGPVLRWILPPSHTLALVEFSSNQDASNAFKKLAFKRYRSVPIYLEWAPRDIFDARSKPSTKAQTVDTLSTDTKNVTKKEQPDKVAAALTSLQDGTDDAIDSATIFVKNVAFRTKKASFEKHFRKCIQECGGELKSAKIAQRNKDGKQVSAGFGFVECSSEEVARSVIEKLQGSSLDGHNLVLQLSQSKSNTSKETKAVLDAPKQAATKVIVRNLAFEATRDDVMNLFTAVAEVKSCRLPKKFDGSHRGFAFVEFASAGEAKNAMSAVSGTHLYGRRLVIEWASEEDQASLEEAKKKTGNGKKRKYSE
jgi:multiple RNA-binding domain-containing protein 1